MQRASDQTPSPASTACAGRRRPLPRLPGVGSVRSSACYSRGRDRAQLRGFGPEGGRIDGRDAACGCNSRSVRTSEGGRVRANGSQMNWPHLALGGALIFSADAGEVRPMPGPRVVYQRDLRGPHPPAASVHDAAAALPDGLVTLIVEVPQARSCTRVDISPGRAAPCGSRRKRCAASQRGRSVSLADEEIIAGTGVNTLDAALVDRFARAPARRRDAAHQARPDPCSPTVPGSCFAPSVPASTSAAPPLKPATPPRATQLDADDLQIRDAVAFARRHRAARKAPGRGRHPKREAGQR